MAKINKIGVVCYGNICRSQVLGIYLSKFLKEKKSKIKVCSAGVAPHSAYPNSSKLVKEVKDKLIERGIKTKPKRKSWSEKVSKVLKNCDIIIAADEKIKFQLVEKLGKKTKNKIYKFYEFIGEKDKNFEDTYDYKKGCQNPVKFNKCFNELERIAAKAAEKLSKDN